MTDAFSEEGSPAGGGAGHVSEDVLSAYVAGSVDEVLAWSVEAHVTACPACRLALSAYVDPDHLARNRSVLLVRTATGEHHPARRVLSHVGVPDHLVALMAATPSLRRSSLLSVLGVLALVTGESVLAHHLSSSPLAVGRPGWGVLTPFLLVAPLMVLAGVAAAFMPVLDPTHQLAAAAPFSGLGLLLVRSLSALVAALVPVVVVAFVVPGPVWLPAALFALLRVVLPCAGGSNSDRSDAGSAAGRRGVGVASCGARCVALGDRGCAMASPGVLGGRFGCGLNRACGPSRPVRAGAGV